MATTARLVDEALGLLEHAKNAGDRRTALSALREARDGLALLMRVAGLLAPDAAVSVHVDARRQGIELIAKLTEEELRAFAAGGKTTLEDVIDNRALSGSMDEMHSRAGKDSPGGQGN